jgi:hypothetical protein
VITVDKSSLKARLFRMCLKHPLARGNVIDVEGKLTKRPVDWYLENGTTLCHFFWTCFWLPLATVALVGAMFGLWFVALVSAHVEAYHNYGIIGLFMPIGILIGVILALALIILSIIGVSKVGLWDYLKAIKERVCPRMAFK